MPGVSVAAIKSMILVEEVPPCSRDSQVERRPSVKVAVLLEGVPPCDKGPSSARKWVCKIDV